MRINNVVNIYLHELDIEIRSFTRGTLSDRLYKALEIPIFQGKSMSYWPGSEIPELWFRKHSIQLWEDITKCNHSKDIENLFKWLQLNDPSFEAMKKYQDEAYKLAENLQKYIEHHWLRISGQ